MKTKITALFALLILAFVNGVSCESDNASPPYTVETLNGRQFLLMDQADGNKHPVVIALHGGRQDMYQWVKDNASKTFPIKAEAAGYIVVMPDSLAPICPDTKQWDVPSSSSIDVAFISSLIQWLKGRDNVDDNSIFICGISCGAFMTSRMADAMGSASIAGVFIHSGGYYTQISFNTADPDCKPDISTGPVAVKRNHPPALFVHGKKDNVVPHEAAESYDAAMKAAGLDSTLVLDANGRHNWLSAYDSLAVDWMNAHRR